MFYQYPSLLMTFRNPKSIEPFKSDNVDIHWCHFIPFHAIPCHSLPFHAISCHFMLFGAISCHFMLLGGSSHLVGYNPFSVDKPYVAILIPQTKPGIQPGFVGSSPPSTVADILPSSWGTENHICTLPPCLCYPDIIFEFEVPKYYIYIYTYIIKLY